MTTNNIDLNIPRIGKFLSAINTNKACGQDVIRGKVLKNCFQSLAVPLSSLFIIQASYLLNGKLLTLSLCIRKVLKMTLEITGQYR